MLIFADFSCFLLTWKNIMEITERIKSASVSCFTLSCPPSITGHRKLDPLIPCTGPDWPHAKYVVYMVLQRPNQPSRALREGEGEYEHTETKPSILIKAESALTKLWYITHYGSQVSWKWPTAFKLNALYFRHYLDIVVKKDYFFLNIYKNGCVQKSNI